MNNSFNTTNSHNLYVDQVNVGVVADEKSEILAWLSPLEPRIRHHDIRTRRVDEVGNWLLQTEEYRNWFHSMRGGEFDNSVLFGYGDPGVGKTYICSVIVDRLCDWARGQNAAVACFYFDFAAQKEQSPTNMLGSLLKQIVSGMEEIPENIIESFREQKKVIGGRNPELAEIVEMLQDILSVRPTFICLDALDECVAEHRSQLLDSLKQILQKSLGTRIFLAGRPHIRVEIEKHLAGRLAVVSIIPTKEDIIRFLRAKLKEDTTPDAMDRILEEEIIKNISETVSEIFLLVSLNIEAILQETTIHRRREKLRGMTNGLGLGDAYDATIGRIKAQGKDRARLGMAALMWISHSERPLQVDELCHALAVEIGSTDLNTDNVPSIWTVLGCCHGLIAVDKGSSTIRLIHFTLKEYLSNHADLFNGAHSRMAEACLTYLNFQAVRDLSSIPSHYLQDTPFLEYSSLYWGTHLRTEPSDGAESLALKLLHQYDSHISARLLWRLINAKLLHYWGDSDKPFSALHCISYFGVAKVATTLINMQTWDVNQRDSAGLTPLAWAARFGHEEVVKLLLRQKNTKPNIPDTLFGQTALSWAAINGHEAVVSLFLRLPFTNSGSKAPRVVSLIFGRRYASADRPDNHGRTPLSLAAMGGHEGVVKLLLGCKNVNPDRPNNHDNTPLSLAAIGGHEGVVKLLLGCKNVNPDRLNNDGRTPLSLAAMGGHEGVVKLLLGCGGVSPDRPNNDGRTPLSLAAMGGHEGVVKLLLGCKNVNPDRPNNDGRTPLSLAAMGRHEGVVKLLLGCKNVNPDRPNNHDNTPLSSAAMRGHEEVVKLLLGCKNVNPDRPNNDGQTPLSLAAVGGHEGVVKLLLGREDVNPDRQDYIGRTVLSLAASNWHEGVVKLILGRGDVNPDRPDNNGRTPLSWAARDGKGGVVKLLLGRGDVGPDRPDNIGRTPLSWAAMYGNNEAVELLLEREDVSPDKPDKCDRTPISWAAISGHDKVVELLLRRNDVNSDRPDTYRGQTPFSLAAEKGHEGVLKLLLGRGGINPDRPDTKYGQTPLSLAAENGRDEVLKLLLGLEDVNPDKPDTFLGQTPLSLAAENGRYGVAKLLLGRKDVNPDRPDNNGRTPLWWAVERGHDVVVQLLKSKNVAQPGMP